MQPRLQARHREPRPKPPRRRPGWRPGWPRPPRRPDLVGALSKELGASPGQAAGAAGALFGLAKSRLKPEEFGQISKAVPGMDSLLSAPAAAAVGTSGLGQLAGSAAGLASAASAFRSSVSSLSWSPRRFPCSRSSWEDWRSKRGRPSRWRAEVARTLDVRDREYRRTGAPYSHRGPRAPRTVRPLLIGHAFDTAEVIARQRRGPACVIRDLLARPCSARN